MATQTNKLGARKVEALSIPGMHSDGGGLYLRISSGGRLGTRTGKRWVFLYKRPRDGKRCEMGLGGFVDVSLALAREKAAEARAQIARGVDPMVAKHSGVQTRTFGEIADRHIESMSVAWKNEKHRAQWVMTMREYAAPLRSKPVDEISTADVLAILKPIWSTIPETANRVRGRIENVLDAAKAQGHRSGENPAAWRGHLKLVLPARKMLTRGHHARMAIDAVPAFIGRLREREAVAGRCLEFAILTVTRTSEALGTRWDEIDVARKVWTIPGMRMKAGVEHRVPLCDRALAILEDMRPLAGGGGYVFPGQRRGKPLSNMACLMMLRRMGVIDATVHGFRSCFRDWCGNSTNFPRELAQHAMAHAFGDKAERAYRRDDALERRRPLMAAWGQYCEPGTTDNVLPFKREAGE